MAPSLSVNVDTLNISLPRIQNVEVSVLYGSLDSPDIRALGSSSIDLSIPCRPSQSPTFQPILLSSSLDQRNSFLFVGRKQESLALVQALVNSKNVHIYGAGGIGKTSFLRHFFTRQADLLNAIFPDGVVSPTIFDECDIEDIAQAIFSAFFRSPFYYKPSLSEIERYFYGKRFLIIYDQRTRPLSQADVRRLSQTFPSGLFIYVSEEQADDLGDVSIYLGGLLPAESRILAQNFLGFSLGHAEQMFLDKICDLLQGNPSLILHSLRPVRHQASTLLQQYHRITQQVANPDYPSNYPEQLYRKSGQEILSVLSIFKNYGLTNHQVKEILAQPSLNSMLADLKQAAWINDVSFLPNPLSTFDLSQEGDRIKLGCHILQALNDQTLVDYSQSIHSYFLGLNWSLIIQDQNLSTSDISPLVMLFRQAVQQSDPVAMLTLGDLLAFACLRLGLWGMRENVFLSMLEVCRHTPLSIQILLNLGLQKLCVSRYDQSLHYLQWAQSLCDIPFGQSYASVIHHYIHVVEADQQRHQHRLTPQRATETITLQVIDEGGKGAMSAAPLETMTRTGVPTTSLASDRGACQSLNILDRLVRACLQSIHLPPLRHTQYGTLGLSLGMVVYLVLLLNNGSLFSPAPISKRDPQINNRDRPQPSYDSGLMTSGAADQSDLNRNPRIQSDGESASGSILKTQGPVETLTTQPAQPIHREPQWHAKAIITPQSSSPNPVAPAQNDETERLSQSPRTIERQTSQTNQTSRPQPEVSQEGVLPPSPSIHPSDPRTISRPPSNPVGAVLPRPNPHLSEPANDQASTLSAGMCRTLEDELALAEQSGARDPNFYRALLVEGGCH